MDGLVDISTWRYAVISVRSGPGRERWVIAYPDEETLRDLIAAPSIVALGYNSRADALKNKNIDRCITTAASLRRWLKISVLQTNLTLLAQYRVALQRLADAFGISGTSKIMRNLVHNSLAVALIFFYSRNVLSSTIRAFISF